jgi:hypothetical protein
VITPHGVAMSPDGSFVVSWAASLDFTVSVRRFAADGTPLSDQVVVALFAAPSPAARVAVQGCGGNHVVTWTEQSETFSGFQTLFVAP